MADFLNGVQFLPASGGTADFVVSAAVQGYLTPAGASAVNGRTYGYRAESADLTQWEIGRGAYTSGSTTLARTTVLLSSTGSKISFSTPPKVGLVELAADIANTSIPNTFTGAQTFVNSIVSNAAPGTEVHLDTSGMTAIPVANGANAKIAPFAGFGYYLLCIADTSNGHSAIYVMNNANIRSIDLFGTWGAPTVTPGAGVQTVAYDGVADYRTYNNKGGTSQIKCALLRFAG